MVRIGIDLGFTEESLRECEYSLCGTYRGPVAVYALEGKLPEVEDYRDGDKTLFERLPAKEATLRDTGRNMWVVM